MDHTNQQAWFALAGAYKMAGQNGNALNTVEKLVQMNPEPQEALLLKQQLTEASSSR